MSIAADEARRRLSHLADESPDIEAFVVRNPDAYLLHVLSYDPENLLLASPMGNLKATDAIPGLSLLESLRVRSLKRSLGHGTVSIGDERWEWRVYSRTDVFDPTANTTARVRLERAAADFLAAAAVAPLRNSPLLTMLVALASANPPIDPNPRNRLTSAGKDWAVVRIAGLFRAAADFPARNDEAHSNEPSPVNAFARGRVILDPATRSINIDGRKVASNLPDDAFHFFRLLAEAYPKGISWAKMQGQHAFDDSNAERVKQKIPQSVERFIRREGTTKPPRLELPDGM